jgi:hypothetical protein
MMIGPQQRLSVYDIVRPPVGFAIDTLVVCTYSASLDTVLSLPAAMLADLPGMSKRRVGIFTTLELAALKRVCGRTLIFCQGGAIHPAAYLPPAIIEAERMVHEVRAPIWHRGPDPGFGRWPRPDAAIDDGGSQGKRHSIGVLPRRRPSRHEVRGEGSLGAPSDRRRTDSRHRRHRASL